MESAIATWKQKHPQDTFATTWHPFYLNPDAPKQGIDKEAFYRQKFGAERTAMMFGRLSAIGNSVGINFKYGGRTGNTRDAHRLVQLGKTHGSERQTRVIEELFTSYFENEKDITSLEVLKQIGVDAGLDAKEVKEWLESDKGGPQVDSEVRDAQRNFISGVPNFTIQGKFHLQGAEDPTAFLEIFEHVSGSEPSVVQERQGSAQAC